MSKEQLALQLLILALQNSDEIARLFAKGTTSDDLDALVKENADARKALQDAIDAAPAGA